MRSGPVSYYLEDGEPVVLSGFTGARVSGVRLDLDFDRIVGLGYRKLFLLEGSQVFVVDEDGNEVRPPGRFEVEWDGEAWAAAAGALEAHLTWPSYEPAVLRDRGWFAEGALVLHGGSPFSFLAGVGAGFVPADPALETLVEEVCRELDGVAPVTAVHFSEWVEDSEGDVIHIYLAEVKVFVDGEYRTISLEFWRDYGMLGDLVVDDDLDEEVVKALEEVVGCPATPRGEKWW
ncbi:MAG: hypothetical protein ABGY09_04410 [Euryarchaeota archaeon]